MKLKVENLVKKFNSINAVNDISFEIEKNSTLGLLGPNGCGKTTSIGMMLGLITPTSGKIYIDDTCLEPKNRIELLSLMNFASPYIELPKKLTVKQNLEVYARLYGVVEINKRVDEMVEDLNIKSFLYKKMRNAEYDCDCRVVNQFPTMEEALDWEKKLIKRTPYTLKLNSSFFNLISG